MPDTAHVLLLLSKVTQKHFRHFVSKDAIAPYGVVLSQPQHSLEHILGCSSFTSMCTYLSIYHQQGITIYNLGGFLFVLSIPALPVLVQFPSLQFYIDYISLYLPRNLLSVPIPFLSHFRNHKFLKYDTEPVLEIILVIFVPASRLSPSKIKLARFPFSINRKSCHLELFI